MKATGKLTRSPEFNGFFIPNGAMVSLLCSALKGLFDNSECLLLFGMLNLNGPKLLVQEELPYNLKSIIVSIFHPRQSSFQGQGTVIFKNCPQIHSSQFSPQFPSNAGLSDYTPRPSHRRRTQPATQKARPAGLLNHFHFIFCAFQHEHSQLSGLNKTIQSFPSTILYMVSKPFTYANFE